MISETCLIEESKKIINGIFFNNSPMIAFIWKNDKFCSVEAVSKNIESILGYHPNSFLTNIITYSQIIHSDDLNRINDEVKYFSHHKKSSFEHTPYRIKNSKGIYKWVKDSTYIIYNEDGKISHFIGYIFDCTDEIENTNKTKAKELELHKTEDELIKSKQIWSEKELLKKLHNQKQRFENMFKNHDSIMLLIKPETGEIIDANISASKFYGYSHQEFLTINITELNELSKELVKEKIEEAKNSKNNQFEFNHILKNKEIRRVKVHSSPIQTEDGVILFSIIEDITKVEEYHKQIEIEKSKLQTIIHTIPDLLWIKDLEGKYILCNRRFEELYNTQIENIIGKTDYDFVNKELADFFRKYDKVALSSQNTVSTFRELQFLNDGHKEYVHTTKTKVLDKDGNILGILGIGRDTTNIKRYQDELEKQHSFIETILNMQPTMILLTNGKNTMFVNHTLLDFYNCKDLYDFVERYGCICQTFMKNDFFFNLDKISEHNQNWIDEINKLPKEHRLVAIQTPLEKETRIFRIVSKNYKDSYHIVTLNDITETIFKQLELEEKNIHDKLTNCFNREYFENNIDNLLYENKQNRVNTAIIMIDIDYFKKVNDNYGHDVGDIILKELVNLMRLKSRNLKDVLIRWGGEEFLMIIPIRNEEYLKIILEKYRKTIQEHSFSIVKKITCSFGATIHKDSEKIENSIKKADIALYESKNKGRNSVTIML